MSVKNIKRAITAGVCCCTAAAIVGAVVAKGRKMPDLSVVTASPDVQKVAGANTKFTFSLLDRLTAAKPGENVFISPYSVSNAMSLVLNGAAGSTYHGIEKGLGLDSTPLANVNRGNSLLLPSLENPDPQVELSVANALWARRGLPLSTSFTERCRTYYGATASTLDFGQPSTAASTINGWVGDNTHGKIDSIVSPDDLVRADAVLTNAVYFHGKWTDQFDKANTQTQQFHHEDGTQKSIPLMSEETTVPYLENSRFQAVSLPYGSKRMSLYVILPKKGVKLGSVIKDLDAKAWSNTVDAMQPTEITVQLPRFKVEYAVLLNKPLIDLGMGPAFRDEADFTPMGLRNSAISAVYHKALIEVDEEGTTAAAATAVVVAMAAVAMPPTTVRIDHPFFCAIRDNATGTILFAGAIYDPQTD